MNILVYGAGVLGSLYAARLQEAGQHVSLLARGQRLEEIREHGIVLENVLSGQTTTTRVKVIEQLGPAERYDLAVVVMGKHQVAAILPRLAANKQIPSVLFLHNNAGGPQAMIETLGRERVLLGFAGAGGKREGHVIDYLLIKQQPTTLGEVDGRTTPRLEQMANAFKDAVFPVAISANIDAALKTHAVLFTCVGLSLTNAHPLPGSTWQAVSQFSRTCARERKLSPRSFYPSKDHGIFNRNTRCYPSSCRFFERIS
jgi:2-dehydropantoate 2-reductase